MTISVIGAGTNRAAYNKDSALVARRHQQVIDSFREGVCIDDIAAETEFSPKHVRAILTQTGEDVPGVVPGGTDRIWDLDDDARRIAFARRAQRGARKALGQRGRPPKTKPQLVAPVARAQVPQPVPAEVQTYRPDSSRIVAEVAAEHGVAVKDILGRFRDSKVVTARHEAIWRIRQETRLSFPQIGQKFSRDHSTIIHGYKQHERRMASEQRGDQQ
ncbi:helix-turn-helix domain-containing protein [Devosia aurantiaca]|uniref:Chromosomal replication initiator DnaA C-terminal domain-containing protein n=1 Tax=Devosia aurantiaca TaxID=2714858 RepID=A0A6M1SQ15_9HYPH|nr:helix-turn-helix domain-containing protein [Devosia aurantiaca]NGP19318.1 hypothetical protein [Devosia aurantiaca]